MKPTPKLRYVEREVRIPICEGMARCEQHKFLQQWWSPEGATSNEIKLELNGEWRDVPLEKEA